MISIVIPCHNEQQGIQEVIPKLPQGAEIIVVDNGCTDKTSAVATRLGAKVVAEPRLGYGLSLRAGFVAATGDIVVSLDGDGQYPAEDIPKLVEHLQGKGLDFLSASRFPLRSGQAMSFTRQAGNFLLTLVANILFGVWMEDSQSGMWIFKKSVLDRVNLENDSMPLSEEIKLKVLLDPDLRFGEAHIDYRPRIGESTLFPFKHGWENLKYLFRLRMETLKQK
jgi:hypothetical protein